MYVTLKNGKRLRMPTDEEDAAITAAAMSDPDAIPYTDEEWEAVQPFVQVDGVSIDARAVRENTGLSQSEFARLRGSRSKPCRIGNSIGAHHLARQPHCSRWPPKRPRWCWKRCAPELVTMR